MQTSGDRAIFAMKQPEKKAESYDRIMKL